MHTEFEETTKIRKGFHQIIKEQRKFEKDQIIKEQFHLDKMLLVARNYEVMVLIFIQIIAFNI